MYGIQGTDVVELFDVAELITRAYLIDFFASEKNPKEWRGSVALRPRASDVARLSSRKDRIFTVRFNDGERSFSGLARLTLGPLNMGDFYWAEFCGVDVLYMK